MSFLQKSWLAGFHGVYPGVLRIKTGLRRATGDRSGVLIRDEENICVAFVPQTYTFSLRFSGRLQPELDPGGLALVPARRSRSPAAEYQDGVIAGDGKALRRSSADASKRQPPHPAPAFATGTRPAPAQTAADGKPDEITAISTLLKLLDIQGRTAAADAVHAPRAVSEAVKDGGAPSTVVNVGWLETH